VNSEPFEGGDYPAGLKPHRATVSLSTLRECKRGPISASEIGEGSRGEILDRSSNHLTAADLAANLSRRDIRIRQAARQRSGVFGGLPTRRL
jgi:hypothetical protein